MSSISRGLLLFLIASITAGCQTTSLERTLSYNQGKLREAEEQRDRLEFQLATSERQQQEAVAELVGFQKRIADFRAKNAALIAENEMLIARPIPASAAAMAITKNAKICPAWLPGINRLEATSTTLTALSMSSILISMS